MTSPVALVVNPSKARAQEAIAIVRREVGAELLVLETTVAEPGARQARQALEAGATLVIAAGGDGTVREVASVLAGTDVPLGILPLGTGNLLARNLGLRPGRLATRVAGAIYGRDRRIDVARVRNRTTGETRDSLFLVMAGIGIDARVVGDTRHHLKGRIGWLAYGEAAMRHLRSRPLEVTLEIDGDSQRLTGIGTVMIGNCGVIPLGLRIFPQARFDDGLLDVVIAAPRTPLGWAPIAGHVLTGHRLPMPDSLQVRTARELTLRPRVPTAIQLDGDAVPGVTKLNVWIEPKALVVRSGARGRIR